MNILVNRTGMIDTLLKLVLGACHHPPVVDFLE